MRIEVVVSPREREVDLVELVLAEGSTVADAVQASGLLQRHAGITATAGEVGVWGRPCRLEDRLGDGDRVELYRPLQADPKEARRQRQRRQGQQRPALSGTRRR